MKRSFLMAISLVLCATASGCSRDNEDGFIDNLLKGGGSAVPVTAEAVVAHERAAVIKAPAVLAASDTVDVVLPEDVTVESVFVRAGDTVDVGETLFRISERDVTTQISKTRMALRDAKAELEKHAYLLRNRDRLLEEGRIDQNQYDSLSSDFEESESNIEKLQTELNELEGRIGNSNVTSPIGGVVMRVIAAAGLVMPAQKPAVTISKINPILAAFKLASYEAEAVQPGMKVEVRVPDVGAEAINGEIAKVNSTIDPDDQMFQVWASIPNPLGHLKVGMNAEVEFTSSETQRYCLIPTEALIKERRRYYVFTVINGVAHKVRVLPKRKKGQRVEIAQGLKENDIIVVRGHDKLVEGTVVDIWGK